MTTEYRKLTKIIWGRYTCWYLLSPCPDGQKSK